MTKKKRNIIIVSTVVLIALVLSLSLGLTLGRKSDNNQEWSSIVGYGGDAKLVLANDKEIISSDVKITDLSQEYRQKLLDLTSTNLQNWKSENIFRNRQNLSGFGEISRADLIAEFDRMLSEGTISQDEYQKWNDTFLNEAVCDWEAIDGTYNNKNVLNVFKYENVENFDKETYEIKFAQGHEDVQDGELIIDKWTYYSLYLRTHDISINIEKVKDILDAKYDLPKNIILRNCTTEYMGFDGMAAHYFGILPDDLSEALEVTLQTSDKQTQKFKVVGYFEDKVNDDLYGWMSKSIDYDSLPNIKFRYDNRFEALLNESNWQSWINSRNVFYGR